MQTTEAKRGLSITVVESKMKCRDADVQEYGRTLKSVLNSKASNLKVKYRETSLQQGTIFRRSQREV